MMKALVTGGRRGIGAAVAKRLLKDGLEVITCDLSDADYHVDVSDEAAVTRIADEIGPIDVLINSAGVVGPHKPLAETSADEWQSVYSVNVFGAVNMMRAFLPGMVAKGWGRVVNLSSVVGKEGSADLSIYASSKAALICVTKSVGKELAKTGVIVNAVTPAVISTPMTEEDSDPEYMKRTTSLIPMGRVGRVEEVAELVAFLASERVSFSTGAVFDISGGRASH